MAVVHRPFRFAPPEPGPSSLLRPRLLRDLNERWQLRMLVVQAGAGMGKTTLLTQALAENLRDPRGRDVWLSLEPQDSSASSLLGSLLEALGVLGDSRRVATVDDVCDAVWATAPMDVCLVLDEMNSIVAGSGGAIALAELVQALPANGHLLLTGRTLPDVGMARLLAQGRARLLTDADLCFDADELARFAASRGADGELLAGAGGWPALAELRARSGLALSDDFVREEVLASLNPEQRHAFALIATVGGGDAEVVRAAAGVEPGESFDWEVLASLPLVVADGRGGLRPHALWAELGEVAAFGATPVDMAASRRRVAEVLRVRGDHAQAFELLSALGDWPAALRAVFDACNDQRHPPWPDRVRRWRSAVPAGMTDEPEVIYLDAYLARSTDPWSDGAAGGLRRAADLFRERRDMVSCLTAEIRLLWTAWLRGDRDAIRRIDETAQLVLNGRMGEPLAGNLAMLADIDGETASLRMHAERMRDAGHEPRLRHFPGIHRTTADIADGVADGETALWARQAADAATAVEPAAGTGWALTMPALVAWARGRLDEAIGAQQLQLSSRLSVADRVPCVALTVVVAAHLARRDEADQALKLLDEMCRDVGDHAYVAGYLAVAHATLLLSKGDVDGAGEALRHRLEGHELTMFGAGRAVLWFPAVPYLLDARCRTFLDERGSGKGRRPTIDACRALLDVGSGALPSAVQRLTVLDDAAGLLTVLPAAVAVELAAIAHANGDPRASRCVESIAERVGPSAREHLRHVERMHGSAPVRQAASRLLADVPITPGYDVRVEVLGPARLRVNGVAANAKLWKRERVRQLLLALVALREVPRARIGAMLWPDFDEVATSANLRSNLSYLQDLLEPDRARGESRWFVRQDDGVLHLGGPELRVDAWELERFLDASDTARTDRSPWLELSCLLSAMETWKGEYLQDVASEEWAIPIRDRFQTRVCMAGIRAAELLVAAGRFDEAIRIAGRVIEADSWSEPAYRVTVRAHLGGGNKSAARRTLDACRRNLDDLGVTPDRATQDLEGLLGN